MDTFANSTLDLNRGPFGAGSVVMVTLNQPREKFWGAVLGLTPAGLSVYGVDLNSFADFVRMVNAGEHVFPNMVFFPMHRIERMEADTPNGDIPSLQEQFQQKTGRDFKALFVHSGGASA